MDRFTLSKIVDEKVLMFGGMMSQGPSSELRAATILGDSVVSVCSFISILFQFKTFVICQWMVGESDKCCTCCCNSVNLVFSVFAKVMIVSLSICCS